MEDRFRGNEEEAFAVGCCYALSPSVLIFLPALDQTYLLLTSSGGALYPFALRRGRPIGSLLFGLTLAVALFFAYDLLVLGAFFLLFGILEIFRQGRRGLMRLVLTATHQSLMSPFGRSQ